MSNYFLKKDNVQILWDVLADNEVLRSKPRAELVEINRFFNSNLTNFYQANKGINNLVELNKNYVSFVMHHVQQSQQQAPALVTAQDIQNNRKNEFERNLKERQDAFNNSFANAVPEQPDFSDKKDKPIENLEMEMKRYVSQRNYEIQNIAQPQLGQSNNWLQSQQTSVKSEKLQNEFKTIKIDSSSSLDTLNEVIDLEALPSPNLNKKQIRWAENLTNEQEEMSFLSKLKPLPTQNNEITDLKDEMRILNQKMDKIIEILLKVQANF